MVSHATLSLHTVCMISVSTIYPSQLSLLCHFFHDPFLCYSIHFLYMHTLSDSFRSVFKLLASLDCTDKGVVVVTNSDALVLNIVPTYFSMYKSMGLNVTQLHQVLFPCWYCGCLQCSCCIIIMLTEFLAFICESCC